MELFPTPRFGTLRRAAGISLTSMVDGANPIRRLIWRAAGYPREAICCFWTATWNGESFRPCASEPMAAFPISGGEPAPLSRLMRIMSWQMALAIPGGGSKDRLEESIRIEPGSSRRQLEFDRGD